MSLERTNTRPEQTNPLQQSGLARGLLAHPQDIHCVVYHLVTLVAYLAAFGVWLNPSSSGLNSTADRIAFVLGAGLLLGWCSGVDVGVNFHNHTHRRIFKGAGLNRWFGRLWTFSGGWPSLYWQHAHVVVHHANVLETNDWTVPRRTANGELESIYRYLFAHWPWRYGRNLYQDFALRHAGRRLHRKAVVELAIFSALWSIPFWIDPVMGLCLWLLPHWIGNLVMAAGMYVQHAGCRPKSEAELLHSTTFLCDFFNMTMFNIGYHIEHHDNPAVHWSALPRLHQAFAPKLRRANSHVVPYGYFRAAHLISSHSDGIRRFNEDSAPGFGGIAEAELCEEEFILRPLVSSRDAGAPLPEPAHQPLHGDRFPASMGTTQNFEQSQTPNGDGPEVAST